MITKVEGATPLVAILIYPRSLIAPPPQPALEHYQSFVSDLGSGGLADFWWKATRQRLDLRESRALGWFAVDQNVGQLNALTPYQLGELARSAATAAGHDLRGFPRIMALAFGTRHFKAGGPNLAIFVQTVIGEPGWRTCLRCQTLHFWDGSRPLGTCFAGGPHQPRLNENFSVDVSPPSSAYETGWRRCTQCECLVKQASPCPRGGLHVLALTDHAVRVGPPLLGEQSSWRRCNRCHGLTFFDGTGTPGRCSGAGDVRHDVSLASVDHTVREAWTLALAQVSHEHAHTLGLAHAHGSGPADIVNDALAGAYADRTDIMGNPSGYATARFTPAGGVVSAPTLWKMGWITEGESVRIDRGAGTRTVNLLPLHGTATGIRMAQVVRADVDRVFTASFRHASGIDQGIGTSCVVIHAQRGLYAVGQELWSYCAGCNGMIAATSMRCPAGGIHNGDGSAEYHLLHDVGPSAGQPNWRWCSKCEGLAFAGNPTAGFCPAGGSHALGGFDYVIPSSGSGVASWRWCRKCEGMINGDYAFKGACPRGGVHDPSASPPLVLGTSAAGNRQPHWRECNRCRGLFFAGRGTCAGGSVHRLSGDPYALTTGIAGAFGQSGWKRCNKCRGLAFSTSSRPPGRCPAGDLHDHTGSETFTLSTELEQTTAQTGWRQCDACGGVHWVGAGGPGRCSVAPRHTLGQAYLIAQAPTALAGDNRFRWCNKCSCLVNASTPKPCAGGSNHDTSGSSGYVVRNARGRLMNETEFISQCTQCNILMRLSSDGVQRTCPGAPTPGGGHTPSGAFFLTLESDAVRWRWCSRCELLAQWHLGQEPGLCPAGGRHQQSASLYYVPPRLAEERVELVRDDMRAGTSFTVDVGGTTFAVDAITDTQATVRITN